MAARRMLAAVSVAMLALLALADLAIAATVNVSRAGSGSGTVTSDVGPINCGASCSAVYADGTLLTLTASAGPGSQFTGWLGPCTGTGACSFTINGNTVALATFASSSLGVPTLDVDGNHAYSAATDALALIRYLFGATGPSWTADAIGSNATRTTDSAIGDYLTDIRPALDIDGDGQADALTDGLLIIRYLTGVRGPALIAGAVAPGAIRDTHALIEGALAALSPVIIVLPPDPSTIAPPPDPSVATGIWEATTFLYAGPNAIQTGVAPGTIEARRAAVLRGKVQNRDGTPLAGTTISILGHPEFGQTLSRADGMFDLAVNGGGVLTVDYRKAGFLVAQRPIPAPWRDYAWLPDVVLIPYDAAVTTIDLAAPGLKTARGSPVSDVDGARRATILFPAGTTATMKLPGGGTQPLASLDVRATEYTIGPMGPKAMPAPLPPSSGYTYAAEFSIDEVLAAGATEVTFSQPLPTYVENFLGFPVGGAVPAGFYDREAGQWVASANGRVIKVLAINGSAADLDIDGDAIADDATKLATIGITADERTRLAQLYTAGQTLWRVPVTHFSPYDFNWPYGPPPGAQPPKPPRKDPRTDPQDEKCGSVIGCQRQTLGEMVPVSGTPFSMHYTSDRVPGRKDAFTVQVPLSGTLLTADLLAIRARVTIAGRIYEQAFAPAPDLDYTVVWDGKDAYGRTLQGAQVATVRVDYDYAPQYYAAASDFQNSFARAEASGAAVTINREASTVSLSRNWTVVLGVLDGRTAGLGGWSLNIHHAYDHGSQTLYFGDGRRRPEWISGIITVIAGNGVLGIGGDGGPAIQANLAAPEGLAVGPDGSVFIADPAIFRIRRVAPSGVITTVAGNGSLGSGGDGGQATAAQLSQPRGVAIGADGSLYIADAGNHRVRRVRPDGIIVAFAGNGAQGFSGDGGPATSAQMFQPFGVAVAPDGSVYVADSGNSRVRRVAPDGIITTVAGTGDFDFSGDDGPAIAAQLSFPRGVAYGVDGNLYIADAFNNRIRRVGPDGIIVTVAGTGNSGFSGDGGPATLADVSPQSVAVGADGSLYIGDEDNQRIRRVAPGGVITTWAGSGASGFSGDGGYAPAAELQNPTGVALGPDGSLYLADTGNLRVRRVALPLLGFSGANLLLASEDAREAYLFSPSGRHLSTFEALTGAVRYQFGYDAGGYLVSIMDGEGNATNVARSGSAATAIAGPGGHSTALTVNGDGWLLGATNPASESHAMSYSPDGLMLSFTNPRTKTYNLTYDAQGRLIEHHDPAGGSMTLSRTEQTDGHTVTTTSALGRVETYQVEQLATGAIRRTSTAASGAQKVVLADIDGSLHVTDADGTELTVTYSPDPRFGMLSPVPRSVIVKTPGGLTRTVDTARTATLSNPDDLLSLTNLTETESDNGAVSTRVFVNNGTTRTLTTTSAAGRSSTVTLDALGRKTKTQIAGLEPVAFSYDSRGLLTGTVEGVGGGSRTSSMAWNSAFDLSSVADPLGRTAAFVYDSVGRVVTQTLPGSRTISLTYDAAGNTTGLSPPGRPVHAFGYSPIDLIASYTAPALMGGSTTTAYSYNVEGQPTQATRPDSTQVTVSYDLAGRQNGITSPSGTHGYNYDPAGRLAGTTSPGGLSVAYAYDGSLRTGTTYGGPFTGSVNRTYDQKLRLASIDVNGSTPISFSYDADDLLTSVGPLSLTWHAQHGLLTATALGIVSDAWTYNGFAEPSAYSAVANGTPQFSVSYARDSLGRITSLSETVGGVTDVYTYAYGPTGWLSTVHKNGGAVGAYTYDANGNRLSFTGPGGTVAGTYDAQDRLTQYGAATFAYSAAGELQSKTVGGQSTTYDYDALGNLLGVSLPGGPSITYLVDGQRRRAGKKVNGTLVQAFIYQGQYRVVAELNGSGTVVSRFVYATRFNVPEYMIKAGVTYRIVTDHLGSPRLVINSTTGDVAQRMDYDEFGNVLSDTNPGFQPFGFAGGVYDPDTKLVRFGARDYEPATGRWTARDPIGFWGGDSNLYAYASGNPVNETDSDGLLDPKGGFGYSAATYQAGKATVSKGLQEKKGKDPKQADLEAEQVMQEMNLLGEASRIQDLKAEIEKGRNVEANKREIEKILEEIYKRCKEKGRIK